MNIGWGNEHGSKYRLRDHVPGRQDKDRSILIFRSALSHCDIVPTHSVKEKELWISPNLYKASVVKREFSETKEVGF